MIQRFLLVSVYYLQLVLSGLQIADCNGVVGGSSPIVLCFIHLLRAISVFSCVRELVSQFSGHWFARTCPCK